MAMAEVLALGRKLNNIDAGREPITLNLTPQIVFDAKQRGFGVIGRSDINIDAVTRGIGKLIDALTPFLLQNKATL